jgi:hypothetical protein
MDDKDTFTPPPNDGLTLPQIYDFHSFYSPHHPVFKFTSPEGGPTILTWASVSRAVRRGAYLIRRDLTAEECSSGAGRPVAIIANAGTTWRL